MKLGLILFLACGLGMGAIAPRPLPKKKRVKSLTTAQLLKKGPFVGGHTVASLPGTIH